MNLVVSAITMVDLTNKEAKRVHFLSGKNLLTSDHNHLGKSVIMKSIFYTLGAEVFFPAPIKRINLLTFIDFSLDSRIYRIARLKNTFVLYCDNAFAGIMHLQVHLRKNCPNYLNLKSILLARTKMVVL